MKARILVALALLLVGPACGNQPLTEDLQRGYLFQITRITYADATGEDLDLALDGIIDYYDCRTVNDVEVEFRVHRTAIMEVNITSLAPDGFENGLTARVTGLTLTYTTIPGEGIDPDDTVLIPLPDVVEELDPGSTVIFLEPGSETGKLEFAVPFFPLSLQNDFEAGVENAGFTVPAAVDGSPRYRVRYEVTVEDGFGNRFNKSVEGIVTIDNFVDSCGS